MSQPRNRDRVLDWHEELLRIQPELPTLPPAARRAILDVIADFLEEDAEAASDVGAVVVPLHAAAA